MISGHRASKVNDARRPAQSYIRGRSPSMFGPSGDRRRYGPPGALGQPSDCCSAYHAARSSAFQRNSAGSSLPIKPNGSFSTRVSLSTSTAVFASPPSKAFSTASTPCGPSLPIAALPTFVSPVARGSLRPEKRSPPVTTHGRSNDLRSSFRRGIGDGLAGHSRRHGRNLLGQRSSGSVGFCVVSLVSIVRFYRAFHGGPNTSSKMILVAHNSPTSGIYQVRHERFDIGLSLPAADLFLYSASVRRSRRVAVPSLAAVVLWLLLGHVFPDALPPIVGILRGRFNCFLRITVYCLRRGGFLLRHLIRLSTAIFAFSHGPLAPRIDDRGPGGVIGPWKMSPLKSLGDGGRLAGLHVVLLAGPGRGPGAMLVGIGRLDDLHQRLDGGGGEHGHGEHQHGVAGRVDGLHVVLLDGGGEGLSEQR